MTLRRRALVLACGLAASASIASATITPTVFLVVDNNDVYEIPNSYNPATGVFTIGTTNQPYSIGSDEFKLSMNGTIDPDPSIAWGITVTDFGTPSNFQFLFSTPIVPTNSPSIVNGSIVGGLNDFNGNGVAIIPTLPDSDGDGAAELMVNEIGNPLINMGVDVGLPLNFPAGAPGALYNYGAFADTRPGPAGGPWTELSSTVAFSLSGDGDIAVLTGYASVVEFLIPEPASLGLLAAIAATATRRRR